MGQKWAIEALKNVSHGLSFLFLRDLIESSSNAADAEDFGVAGWWVFWDFGTGEPVLVLRLPLSVQSHACAQEGDAIQIAEANRDPSIEAERADWTKGWTVAQEESQSVGQGGDGDGDGGVPVGVSQPVRDSVQDAGPLPARDHYEHIIQSNT